MTQRERIVAFILEFTTRRGFPPSVRDIMEGVGYRSTSPVMHHLAQLEAEGRIVRDPAVARSVRVVA